MHSHSISQRLLILGALLFLIGLLQGAMVQIFHSPRLALSAHIAAVQNGMVLLIFGLLWSRLTLSPKLERTAYLASVAGMVLIWVGFMVAAMTGASMVLKFSGAGFGASQFWELLVAALIYSGSGASILAVTLVLVGLVGHREQ
jgi:(hydroxyamino)benzene mutase